MKPAPVIAVVGPSGVGKDSVMRALSGRDPGLVPVRRVITRPADAGGEDFTAVSSDRFDRLRRDGAFVLDWSAHGLDYGIPAEVEQLRRVARGVLVNLSRSVLTEAQMVFGDLVVLSLTASPEVLATRLADRGREGAEARVRRLARAGRALPGGLDRVIEVDNSGALADTVTRVLAKLQPERA